MNLLDAPFEVVATHSHPVQTVRVSPDGEWVLTGDTERQIALWSGGERRYVQELRTKNPKAATSDRLRSVAFSPDSEAYYIASGTSVQAFRTSDGTRLWRYSLPRVLGFLVTVPLSVDVDGQGRVAIASDNGTFGYRDALGRKLRHWRENAAPRWIRWMQSGESLVGSDSFSIRLWDSTTGETIRGYRTSERVYNLEASPQGDVFAVRTLHAVMLYSVDNDRPVSEIRTREGLPLMAFSPNGESLAVGDSHGIRVFSVAPLINDGIAEMSFEAALTGDVTNLSVAFAADSRSILVGCSDGAVRQYALA